MAILKINNDDIFISYCRSDGTTYTDGLANELTKKGFSCFTDALGTDASQELPVSLIKKLKGCRMLVVVCSTDAARSLYVGKEVELFALTKGTSSIILVDFDEMIGNAGWKDFVIGLRSEKENQTALVSGNPSPAVVNRIEKAFSYRKSKELLKTYTRSAIIVLGILIIAIAGAAFMANKQFQKAKEAIDTATKEIKRANEATKLADQQKLIADQATTRAKLADSNVTEALKRKDIAEAEFKLASQRALAATATAKMQLKIATSLQYATESQTMLQDPNLITGSVDKAVQSVAINNSIGKRSQISDAALRSSLAMLPDLKEYKEYPEKNLFFSTDDKIIEEKSTDSLKQFFKLGENMPFFEIERKDFLHKYSSYRSVSVSGDCNYIAFAYPKLIKIFNTVNKTSKDYTLESDDRSITHIELSPNGKYLVFTHGEDEDFITIWDMERDSMVELYPGYIRVASISFSSNGSSLAIGGSGFDQRGDRSGLAFVWDMSLIDDENFSKQYFNNPYIHTQEGYVEAIAAGNAGNFATSGGYNITVWERDSRDNYMPISYIPHTSFDFEMAFPQDRKELTIIKGLEDDDMENRNVIVRWNYSGHKEIEKWSSTLLLTKIAYGEQSTDVVSLNDRHQDAEYRLARWQNKKDTVESKHLTNFQSEEIKYYTDNLKYIVTIGDSLHIWKYSRLIHTISVDQATIHKVTMTPDGNWLAWVQYENKGQVKKAVVFKSAGNRFEQVHSFSIDKFISTIELTPDGSALFLLSERSFSSTDSSTLLMLDIMKKSKQTFLFDKRPDEIESFKVSPKGKYICMVNFRFKEATNKKYQLEIWDLSRSRKIAVINKSENVDAYTWCQNEKNLLLNVGGIIELFDLDDDELIRITDSSSFVTEMSFSPSGKYFGIGTEKGVIRIFETRSLNEVTRVTNNGSIVDLIFSEDDRYFSVATNNNGLMAITEEENNLIYSWQLLPGDLINEAKKRLSKIAEH